VDVTAVVPSYQEAGVIQETVGVIHRLWSSTDHSFEVIVVDDGSSDATAAAVEVMALDSVRVQRQQHRGKGAAVRAGVAASHGAVVYFVDADLPYGVADQQRIVRAVQRGSPVAVGSRRVSGASVDAYPVLRRASSMVLSMLVRRSLGLTVSDTQCGLKAFRGDLARAIFPILRINGFGWDLELLTLLTQVGISVVECQVTLRHEKASSVNLLRDSVAMLRDIHRIRRRRRDFSSVATVIEQVV
jgi:glycosyltransferase involved in cell wall biosynthesis